MNAAGGEAMTENRFCDADPLMAMHWVDRLEACIDKSDTAEVCEALRYWIDRATEARGELRQLREWSMRKVLPRSAWVGRKRRAGIHAVRAINLRNRHDRT